MNVRVIFGIVAVLFLAASADAAEAPRSLGGFSLGESLERYTDRLEMDTVIKVRHIGCLMEVDVIPPDGFSGGSLNYGTCVAKGSVVRIKLKYEDSSLAFYNQLLERYKKRFGEPDEWKGDPFHVVIAWKWFFKDRNGHQISLILQHNRQDEDEKIGNSVKLTLSDQMAAEIRLGRERHAMDQERSRKKSKAPEWDQLLPQ